MKDYKVTGTFTSGETFSVIVTKAMSPFTAMNIAKKYKVNGQSIKAMSAFPVR